MQMNQARRGEIIDTSDVYVGPLTSAGLVIPIGPAPAYAGQKIKQIAQSYQNYRPLRYTVMFRPSQNETKGAANVSIWQSADPQSGMPKTDKEVMITASNSRGITFFATRARTYSPQIPQLRYNSYSTGGGDLAGGTAYENAMLAMVGITGADKNITNYGEVWLKITIAYSNPAPPTATATNFAQPIHKETWLSLETELAEFLSKNNYAKYAFVMDEDKKKIDRFTLSGHQLSDGQLHTSTIPEGLILFSAQEKPANTPNGLTLGNKYDWKEGTKEKPSTGWDGGATLLEVMPVSLVNRVVLANEEINMLKEKLLKQTQDVRLLTEKLALVNLQNPVYTQQVLDKEPGKKVPVSEDDQLPTKQYVSGAEVTKDRPLPVEEYLEESDGTHHVNLDHPKPHMLVIRDKEVAVDNPMPIEITIDHKEHSADNTLKMEQYVKDDDGVTHHNSSGWPLHVKQEGQVHAHIDDQPIETKQQKDAMDIIEGLGKILGGFLLTESSESTAN